MRDALSHLEDFQLAQKCLEHDPSAIQQLQVTCTPIIHAFLMRSGASEGAAEEVVDQLWADCLVAADNERPRLARYDGSCRVATWLNTVALNRFLTHARSRRRWEEKVARSLDEPVNDDESGGGTLSDQLPDSDPRHLEAPLVQLLRSAITHAFSSCTAEHYVLLQLAYANRLKRADIARVWNCDPTKITRRLKQASDEVEKLAMRHIRARDPWLEVSWPDFLDLCGVTSLGALGLE